MYNYFTDIVISVDSYLLCLFFLMTAVILLHIFIADRAEEKRRSSLLNIKRNVYELILSDGEGKPATCPVLDFTPQQFLDVETNRIKEAVFFNKAEQDAFRDCFVTPEKIEKVAGIALKSGNKWRRIEALMSLGYMGASGKLELLRKFLFNRDEDVSYFSMMALGLIKNGASARVLLEFLRKNAMSRRKVISMLESFEDAAYEAAPLLKDRDGQVRFWVLKLLSRVKSEKYLKAIEALTADKNYEVRAAACECLGVSGRVETREFIIKCLKDDVWLVRGAAIRALSELLGDKCIPDILFMTKDNSLSVLSILTEITAKHIGAAQGFIERSMQGDDPIAKRIAAEAEGLAGYISKKSKDKGRVL